MTQEEKHLLLVDLSARLPYQPICEFTDTEDDFCTATAALGYSLRDIIAGKTLIKPYLRPLSSMTREEKRCLNAIAFEFGEKFLEPEADAISRWNATAEVHARSMDYLNSIHVDCRNLIPMGLALEAPEGMYK